MEQQKQLNLLKQEVNQKNQEIQKSQNQNEEVTTKDSDNLLENSNLYCPISNSIIFIYPYGFDLINLCSSYG